MKLDDLKQDWQQTTQLNSAPENIDEVVTMLETQTKKIDSEIKRRDFIEIAIAFLLIPAWIFGLMTSVSTMQSIGCVIAIISCLYIPYRLVSAKKVKSKKSDSISEFLIVEKQKLSQQKQMLESIVWWYIAPITTAILLITLGSNVDERGVPQIADNMYWYYGSVALLMVGVYFLNKRAAKQKFEPLISNIDNRLSELSL